MTVQDRLLKAVPVFLAVVLIGAVCAVIGKLTGMTAGFIFNNAFGGIILIGILGALLCMLSVALIDAFKRR